MLKYNQLNLISSLWLWFERIQKEIWRLNDADKISQLIIVLKLKLSEQTKLFAYQPIAKHAALL